MSSQRAIDPPITIMFQDREPLMVETVYPEVTSSIPKRGRVFGGRTRYLVLLLSTVCLTMGMGNQLAFNFTVICMNDVIEQHRISSGNDSGPHWLEVPQQTANLFSAIAIGSILGTLPMVHLIQYIGVRNTLTIYGITSGVATFFLPEAVDQGYIYVLIVRVLQGCSFGVSFTALGAISSSWSSIRGAGTYIAIMSSHVQMSSIVTMPLAGALCDSQLGWRVLYYGLGGVTVIAYTVFYLFYRDHPRKHCNVGPEELAEIVEGKPVVVKRAPVPYVAVITNRSIIGVILSSIGGSLGFLVFLYYGPTYMNKVLKFDVKATGMITALPYILAAGVKFAAGPLSDYTTCLSERSRILLFAVASQGVLALCCFTLALTTSAAVAQVAFTAAIVFSGLNIVGNIKCAQLVALQHVHFVLAVISMASCIITLVIPLVVTLVSPNNLPEEWSLIFIGVGVIVIFSNLPFIFLADSRPAPWTKADWKKNSKEIDQEKAEKTTKHPIEDDDDIIQELPVKQ